MCYNGGRNVLVGACRAVVAQAVAAKNGASDAGQYDYDLVIIGCGVGGHGAAMHAVESVSGRAAACLAACRARRPCTGA